MNAMEFKNYMIRPSVWEMDDEDANSMESQKIDRFKQNTRHRRRLVNWMMIIVSSWLAVVLVIVFLGNVIHVEKEVLITLLATTTVNVLGLANIILKGMFVSRSASKNGTKPKQNGNKKRQE